MQSETKKTLPPDLQTSINHVLAGYGAFLESDVIHAPGRSPDRDPSTHIRIASRGGKLRFIFDDTKEDMFSAPEEPEAVRFFLEIIGAWTRSQ